MRYLVTWKANASSWPKEPKGALAILEMAAAGGDQLRQAGLIKDIGWFSAQEGFGIFEADSKSTVVGATSPYFPLYDQEVREIAEWEPTNKAMLDALRQAAGV